jgi:hypothetical protein
VKLTRTIYACPDSSCRFVANEPGQCRSHPYPCRAMGPELVPVRVKVMQEPEPPRYTRQTECTMIAVVGDWNGTDPIVIGAVEESSYVAFVEEGRWGEKRLAMYAESGLDDTVDKDTLRDVSIRAFIPYLWSPPDLIAVDDTTAEDVGAGEALRLYALFGGEGGFERSLNEVAQELIDKAEPHERLRVERECELFFLRRVIDRKRFDAGDSGETA